VRAIRRKYSRQLKQAEAGFVLDVAGELLVTYGYRGLPYELLRHHPAAFQSVGQAELEELGQGIDSWWSVDSFARILAGPAWLKSQVNNVRSQGGQGDVARTLEVCRLLVADHEDMVVKGLSWALRELVVHGPDAVREFLEEHEAVLAARVKREVGNKLTTGLRNP
jgi:hypothetical protein